MAAVRSATASAGRVLRGTALTLAPPPCLRSSTFSLRRLATSSAEPLAGRVEAIGPPDVPLKTSMDIFRPSHIDSHRVLTRLEKHFTRKQAELVTQAIAHHTRVWSYRLDEELLSSTSYDISRILYDSELKSVRNELRLQEKSEFLGVKSELSRLERDIANVDQTIKEALTTLRTNMNIELNNLKITMRDDQKRYEREIAATNFKLQAELSELKTEIEVGKLDIIKHSVVSIIIIVSLLVGFFRLVKEEVQPGEVILSTGD